MDTFPLTGVCLVSQATLWWPPSFEHSLWWFLSHTELHYNHIQSQLGLKNTFTEPKTSSHRYFCLQDFRWVYPTASVHTNTTADQTDKGFIVTKVSRKFMPLADCHGVIEQLSRRHLLPAAALSSYGGKVKQPAENAPSSCLRSDWCVTCLCPLPEHADRC